MNADQRLRFAALLLAMFLSSPFHNAVSWGQFTAGEFTVGPPATSGVVSGGGWSLLTRWELPIFSPTRISSQVSAGVYADAFNSQAERSGNTFSSSANWPNIDFSRYVVSVEGPGYININAIGGAHAENWGRTGTTCCPNLRNSLAVADGGGTATLRRGTFFTPIDSVSWRTGTLDAQPNQPGLHSSVLVTNRIFEVPPGSWQLVIEDFTSASARATRILDQTLPPSDAIASAGGNWAIEFAPLASQFVAGVDISGRIDPLIAELKFEIDVPAITELPGVDPIMYNGQLELTEPASFDPSPIQHAFTANSFLRDALRAITNSNPVDVATTVGLSGRVELRGKVAASGTVQTFAGRSDVDIDLELVANVALEITTKPEGGFCNLLIVGPIVCQERTTTIPITGLPTRRIHASVDLGYQAEETKEHPIARAEASVGLRVDGMMEANLSLKEVTALDSSEFAPSYVENVYTPVRLDPNEVTTSDTGVVVVKDDRIRMETRSPVWASIANTFATPVDVVAFDAEFNGNEGAAGILSVYWNDEFVVAVSNSEVTDGVHTYWLELPRAYEAGTHTLRFQLDSSSEIHAAVDISNIVTSEIFIPVPEPAATWILISGVVGLAMVQQRGEVALARPVK